MRGKGELSVNAMRRDCFEASLLHSTIDEVDQQAKWHREKQVRAQPRESSLDEFLQVFGLVDVEEESSAGSSGLVEFLSTFEMSPRTRCMNDTALVLSPVLDGHESMRSRREKLMTELAEATPGPKNTIAPFVMPPAFDMSV